MEPIKVTLTFRSEMEIEDLQELIQEHILKLRARYENIDFGEFVKKFIAQEIEDMENHDRILENSKRGGQK